jgi:DNA-binding NarL/FixJ family response regulator
MNINVIIFEDNHNLRIGLSQLINSSMGFECTGAYENCSNLLKNIREHKPDIVLMDIGMPGINGIDAVKLIREKHPDLKILMQTVFEEDEKIFASILAGANGYILKNAGALRVLDALKEIYEGGSPMSPSIATKVLKMVSQPHQTPKDLSPKFNLSDREIEILSCLVQGMSYKLIADACLISIDTVRGHIRNIYDKLHVNSKGEAIVKAIRDNIV